MITRLLLADDQDLFVEGLRSVIESRAHDFSVVGVARNGEEAIRKVDECTPDIVLMDVRMPGIDGVEATRRLHVTHPNTKIVMLTTYDDDDYVKRAIRNGAIGYLLKDVPPDELFNAIRTVRDGSFVLPETLASRLFEASPGVYHGGVSAKDIPEWYYDLSRRERHILRLIAEGYDNTEIAAEVALAPQTVKNYSSEIYAKIGVHNRAEAGRVARTLLKYL